MVGPVMISPFSPKAVHDPGIPDRDGWRELDNFAPTVVSQDTYVQYEDTAVSYQAL